MDYRPTKPTFLIRIYFKFEIYKAQVTDKSRSDTYTANLVPRGPFCHALEKSGPLANRISGPIPIGCWKTKA